MKTEKKNKLMPLFVTLILLLSMIVILPQSSVVATTVSFSKTTDLICGETIWMNVTDETLTASQRYYVKVWNGSGFANIKDQRADDDGNIAIKINVPGWTKLDQNPIGEWNLSVFDHATNVSAGHLVNETNITISGLYDVRLKSGAEWLDYVLYNKTYVYPNALYFYVYNWTGTKYELFEESTTMTLYDPAGDKELQQAVSTGYWDIDFTFDYEDGTNLETYYWINVTYSSVEYTNISIPVKLNLTMTVPSGLEWGDTISIANGYVRDGKGNGIGSYTLKLYSPVNNGEYAEIASTTTYSTGRFSFSAPSDEDGGSAGIWYVGTEISGESYRIDETNKLDITDFIKYYEFNVDSLDTAQVSVVSPDEIVSGFNQTINISVRNSFDDDLYYDEMWIHITGLEAVFYGGVGGPYYTDDDIIVVHANSADSISSTGRYAYYEFTMKFNETGTGTVMVTHPLNNTVYEDYDDFKANITGSTTFSVVSPDDMNIIVNNMPDYVIIDEVSNCQWINDSTIITIEIYGEDQDTKLNASIDITGCGLDISIDEDDTPANTDHLVSMTQGVYNVSISPKYAGTLTIEVSNSTENVSGSKDFSISGLTGSVTTSDGDDLEIPVKATETLTATVNNGQYAEVHLTYYDENWVFIGCMNDTIGDGSEGNGQGGIFEFVVTDEDIEEGVGYIVVVAKAGDNLYLYDIVEVAPIHDLVIEIIDPSDAVNQSLTCGLEHNWELKVYDGDGNIVEDVDSVTGEILDEDGDTIQTVTFEGPSTGDIWYLDEWIPHFAGDFLITAVNNTGENEHDGNETLTIGYAVITYTPDTVTAGIEKTNITIEIYGVDANGNTLPDGTRLYINIDDGAGTTTDPNEGDSVTLDGDGTATFDIETIGDEEGKINMTFEAAYDNSYQGNMTSGSLLISFPIFEVNPSEIYIGMANTVEITAYDNENTPIKGINLTLIPSISGILNTQPDPVETDANGQVILSITPLASGKLNVTIARDLHWTGGQLNWTNAVVTDAYITVTSLKTMKISVSKSPIFQGETLTVTVSSGDVPLNGATVEFAESTKTTDSNGQATFTVPDPGVESAIYTITAEKTGYISAEKSITVIKKYAITIIGPDEAPTTGQKFTITILAKGSALAGATITFNGKTYVSGTDGKVSMTAPNKKGDYTVEASYESYTTGKLTIKIGEGGIPGFELITLLAALGVAFILLRRRKH